MTCYTVLPYLVVACFVQHRLRLLQLHAHVSLCLHLVLLPHMSMFAILNFLNVFKSFLAAPKGQTVQGGNINAHAIWACLSQPQPQGLLLESEELTATENLIQWSHPHETESCITLHG
jgi:hypothetical protein